MNFSLATSNADFDLVLQKLLSAGKRMEDGGWWTDVCAMRTTKAIALDIGKDVVRAWAKRIVAGILPAGSVATKEA